MAQKQRGGFSDDRSQIRDHAEDKRQGRRSKKDHKYGHSSSGPNYMTWAEIFPGQLYQIDGNNHFTGFVRERGGLPRFVG